MRRHRIKQSIVVLAAATALFAGGCRNNEAKPDSPETSPELRSGYTCCNFHYDHDWINDGNYAELPMIPAGTPIKLSQIDGYIAYVDIDGTAFRLGLDYGRTLETTEQWVNKLIVQDDPKAKLASYAPNVRKAIQNGQVMLGMTKEQVVMSLGHPETDQNPQLDAPVWRYWRSSFGEYNVHWNSAGFVSEISGHQETVALMTAPGNAMAAPTPSSTSSAAKKSGKSKKGVKSNAKPK